MQVRYPLSGQPRGSRRTPCLFSVDRICQVSKYQVIRQHHEKSRMLHKISYRESNCQVSTISATYHPACEVVINKWMARLTDHPRSDISIDMIMLLLIISCRIVVSALRSLWAWRKDRCSIAFVKSPAFRG